MKKPEQREEEEEGLCRCLLLSIMQERRVFCIASETQFTAVRNHRGNYDSKRRWR